TAPRGRPPSPLVSCYSRWHFGRPACSDASAVKSRFFIFVALAIAAVVLVIAYTIRNDYLFFAGYVVLQFIVLATAWNILGGYCGYVNFGTAAFFAIGTYSSVALHKVGANSGRYLSGTFGEFLQPLFPLSIPTLVV